MKWYIKSCVVCFDWFATNWSKPRRTCSDICAEISKKNTGSKTACKLWALDRPRMLAALRNNASKNHENGVYEKTGKILTANCKKHPEWKAKALEASAKSRLGKFGFGRAARGNINHASAIELKIRDPYGKTYFVKNVRAWCRSNTDLFIDDENCKMPAWLRASQWLTRLARQQDKKNVATSWHGWTAEKWDHTDYLQRNL